MDAIANHLRDPGWWFTAVIVGIAGGVVAGFVKELLEKQFGIFLANSKAKRERAKLARKQSVEAWSQSEGLVLLVMVRALGTTLLIFISMLLDVLLLIYARIHYGGSAQGVPLQMVIMLALLNAAIIWAMFKTSGRTAQSGDCFKNFGDYADYLFCAKMVTHFFLSDDPSNGGPSR